MSAIDNGNDNHDNDNDNNNNGNEEVDRHFRYINHHPYSCYKSYMELIRIFKEKGDLKRLDNLLSHFPHDLFLLPLEEWIEWLSRSRNPSHIDQALKDYPYSPEICNLKNVNTPTVSNDQIMEYENQIMYNGGNVPIESWLNYLSVVDEEQERSLVLSRALRHSPRSIELWQLYFKLLSSSSSSYHQFPSKELLERAKKSVSNPTRLMNSIILIFFQGDNLTRIEEELIGQPLDISQKKELFQAVPRESNLDQWIELLDFDDEDECRNFILVAKSFGSLTHCRKVCSKCPMLIQEYIRFEQSFGDFNDLLYPLLTISISSTFTSNSTFAHSYSHSQPSTKRPSSSFSNLHSNAANNNNLFVELPFEKEKTVFISNLGFKLKEKDLEEFFKKLGISDIKRIDFVRDAKDNRRFKGYAHVEFSSISSHDRALTLDRSKLNGRPVFISPFNPYKREKLISYSSERNENVLYASNLSKELTEQNLEEIFGKYHGFKEVRLVTAKSGASKGFAYIEFIDKDSALAALERENGRIYNGQPISVSISDQSSSKLIPRSLLIKSM